MSGKQKGKGQGLIKQLQGNRVKECKTYAAVIRLERFFLSLKRRNFCLNRQIVKKKRGGKETNISKTNEGANLTMQVYKEQIQTKRKSVD